MALPRQRVWIITEFQAFVALPENNEHLFELINGEIVEKLPGRTRHSGSPMIIGGHVFACCREHGLPFYTSGADGAYRILEHVLAPDFAYKRTPLSDDYPDPLPPLWVVEVIAPTDVPDAVRAKRLIYVAARIRYWEVYPRSRSIDIYVPDQPVTTVEGDAALTVGDVIPGFTIAVREIFREG